MASLCAHHGSTFPAKEGAAVAPGGAYVPVDTVIAEQQVLFNALVAMTSEVVPRQRCVGRFCVVVLTLPVCLLAPAAAFAL